MAKIEGIRVKNFRSLKDVTLGRLWNQQQSEPLTPMTVVIGKNGVGKSTLFDVFGFLSDALKFGVEEACDLRGRGGFEKIRSQGQSAAIELEIAYSENDNNLFTYLTLFNLDDMGRPYVEQEHLFEILDKNFVTDRNVFLLCSFNHGIGFGCKNETDIAGLKVDDATAKKFKELVANIKQREQDFSIDVFNKLLKDGGVDNIEIVELSDKKKLAIATLGALKQHPHISAFREFIEGWYLSYFTPNAARNLPMSGAQQHLNSTGDNLANVVQYMEREHREKFQSILDRIAEKIPGIHKIDTEKSSDGRLLLRFNDKGFQDPFYAPQMSDGTLKVFAYLLLLEDPTPAPFICIEEPENGLYHKLLDTLANEFRTHATGLENSSQLFITTHQPYFVDALDPNEVWILEKGIDGFSNIRHASDDTLVKSMVAEGLPLGGLWYSDYLDAR